MSKRVFSAVLTVLLAAGLLSACGGRPFRGFRDIPLPESGDDPLSGKEIAVVLSDGGSYCADPAVRIDGGTVTVTAAGDYIFSGSLRDGQIVVDAPDDAAVRLILNGVTLIGSAQPALCARSAGELILSSAKESENLLQSSGEAVKQSKEENSAAIFSACPLTLSGSGTLNISSFSGNALAAGDRLTLQSGVVNLEAARRGLSAQGPITLEGGVLNADVGTDGIFSVHGGADAICVEGSTVNLLCQKSGLDAAGSISLEGGELVISAGSGDEGTGIRSDADIALHGSLLTVNAVQDAIRASGSVSLSGGTARLSAGGCGVRAGTALNASGSRVTVSPCDTGFTAPLIQVSGGELRVNAVGDGLRAADGKSDGQENNSLFISGGTVHVNAEGTGLFSAGHLTVSGGSVTVSGSANGGRALDYATDAAISGGFVLAVDTADLPRSFGLQSSQASILFTLPSEQPAGSKLYLLNRSGRLLLSYEPEKPYRSLLISTSDLRLGDTYTLVAGDEEMSATLSDYVCRCDARLRLSD